MFIPFEQMKFLLIKLPVAPQSRRTLTEWSSLVSVVLISTSRSREVSCMSKVLIKRSLGSFFSYLGLWSRAGNRRLEGGVSTSSLSIILGSFIVNTVNLFTGNWGAFIAGHTTQNPSLLGDKTSLTELHLLVLTDLQLTPPAVLR